MAWTESPFEASPSGGVPTAECMSFEESLEEHELIVSSRRLMWPRIFFSMMLVVYLLGFVNFRRFSNRGLHEQHCALCQRD